MELSCKSFNWIFFWIEFSWNFLNWIIFWIDFFEMNNFLNWIFVKNYCIEYWIESFFGKIQILNWINLGIAHPYIIFIVCISQTQGIARFLSACKNETQCLEASKNLLLGQLRVDMLMFELNKLRRGRGSPARKQGNPSYAAVSLSDLRCTGGTDYNLNSYAHLRTGWLIHCLSNQWPSSR